MLTAVAVLALLLILLGQLVGTMSRTWTAGQRRVNNFGKARAMLDLFDLDVQAGIFRPDLGAFPPGTAVAFYTKRPGIPASGAPRNVCLVEYQFDASASSAQAMATLQRADLAVTWTSAAALSLGTSGTLPQAAQAVPRSTAPGVIGFKVLFIQADGTFSATYAPASAANPSRSVGMTLAVVDDVALSQLSAAQVTKLRQTLDGAVSGTRSALADWQGCLRTGVAWSAYPKSLADGLKIFERYEPFPN